jgi:probable phosphomutase (TIGR03848 family)
MMRTLASEIWKGLHYYFRDSLRVVSRIFLLRHAHSVANDAGILAGQLPGVSLSEKGREQAKGLVDRIGAVNFASVRVSPMQRCQETIDPWLQSNFGSGIGDYLLDDQIIEMDYGKWSGKKLSKLSKEKLWSKIQNSPSKVTFPEGEKFTSMQKRAIQSLDSVAQEKKSSNHLLVSHGDVIKAMIAHLLKMKLDNFQSLIVDPASITVIDFDGESARLIAYNDTSSNCEKFAQAPKSMKALLGGGAGSKSRRRR